MDESVEVNEWSRFGNMDPVLSVNYKGNIYNIWGCPPHDIWMSSLPFVGDWDGTKGYWHQIQFDQLPDKVKQEVVVWRMTLGS